MQAPLHNACVSGGRSIHACDPAFCVTAFGDYSVNLANSAHVMPLSVVQGCERLRIQIPNEARACAAA